MPRMHPLVAQHRQAIHDLCRQYRVRRFDRFGSATSEAFDTQRGDLHFLIAFDHREDAAAGYHELPSALEGLFSRSADLVDIRAARNRYLPAAAFQRRENLDVA